MSREIVSLPVLASVAMRGAGELLRLAAAGRMGRGQLWVGLAGAERYLKAVAAGDVADDGTRQGRLRTCRGCVARQEIRTMPWLAGYCGEPLVDRTGEQEPTCGCLVDAKACVRSEHCPRGLW